MAVPLWATREKMAMPDAWNGRISTCLSKRLRMARKGGAGGSGGNATIIPNMPTMLGCGGGGGHGGGGGGGGGLTHRETRGAIPAERAATVPTAATVRPVVSSSTTAHTAQALPDGLLPVTAKGFNEKFTKKGGCVMPDTYISQFSGEEIDSALRAAQMISGASTPAELREKLEIRGDTIPVSAGDSTLISEALTKIPTTSGGGVNPNLLVNWYFGRPVNQRANLSIRGNATYAIDRWWTQ